MQKKPNQPDLKDIDESETEDVDTADGSKVYLVVASENEEFNLSLRYAARIAHKNKAQVGILFVIDEEDFHHWGEVESIIQQELRHKAETFLWESAKKINELNGKLPIFYIAEGTKIDSIIKTIESDPTIKTLILSGRTGPGGPGNLVGYFTGKGLSRLTVPLTLVPGNIEPHRIDAIMGTKIQG